MVKNKYAVAIVLDTTHRETDGMIKIRHDLRLFTCDAVSKEEALGKAMYEFNSEDTGRIKLWNVEGFEPNAIMMEEIGALLLDEKFIAAIKVYRTYTNTDLKTAKNAVEDIRSRMYVEGKLNLIR